MQSKTDDSMLSKGTTTSLTRPSSQYAWIHMRRIRARQWEESFSNGYRFFEDDDFSGDAFNHGTTVSNNGKTGYGKRDAG